jgi:hypothetical protein
MAYLLPHLKSGWEVDQAIVTAEDRVVVIRFGHDQDQTCMVQDEILMSIADKVRVVRGAIRSRLFCCCGCCCGESRRNNFDCFADCCSNNLRFLFIVSSSDSNMFACLCLCILYCR